MATNSTKCHFQFQAMSGFFIDFVEKAKRDASFRATTLPKLGLIERTYERDKDKVCSEDLKMDRKPWEHFRDYIKYLNSQEVTFTKYSYCLARCTPVLSLAV
ncbi:hypothetical protein GGP41_009664 [Bipolaris sorokiniana]|uniref:Uncharacterized protein n=1 Tax=Cochliobolus sativus TaxID=45130 RepID=A0A8H5ZCL8_COCSA|nr:hypothetical protein GGP41_009664 [Bipolaris sorokiniana]